MDKPTILERDSGILAWHFASSTMLDGSSLEAPGGTEVYDGKIKLCKSGLHASVDIMDALRYAPGEMLRRVLCYGDVLKSNDKIVASRREIIFEVDASQALRLFARMVALEVFKKHFSDPIVEEYLKTGREDLRTAAQSAARFAARSAAEYAAWYAAVSAARSAAQSAARSSQGKLLESLVAAARCGRW